MIISNVLKFWFIHNPKVGGSSIRKCLLKYNSSDVELWHQRYIPSLDRIIDMSHIAALDVPHVLLVPDDYFRFGFVRDPYQRFFSAVREHSRQNNTELETKDQISSFVLSSLTHSSVRFDWNFSHFCPQHYYFYSGKRCVADFVGRHSHMSEDWKKALALMDLPFEEHPIGKERDSGVVGDIEPKDLLSAAALRRVNSLYSKDYLLFGGLFKHDMIGDLEHGDHQSNVHNFRSIEGRLTFYGEPPNLTIHEKAGFFSGEIERHIKVNLALTGLLDHHNRKQQE